MSDNIANFQHSDSHYTEEKAPPSQQAQTENTQNGAPKDVGGIAGQRLQSFMERIERLEEEKSALAEDIKEVYAEAKGVGFDAKIIRKIISLRKMDGEKRREEEELLDLYKAAIGML